MTDTPALGAAALETIESRIHLQRPDVSLGIGRLPKAEQASAAESREIWFASSNDTMAGQDVLPVHEGDALERVVRARGQLNEQADTAVLKAQEIAREIAALARRIADGDTINVADTDRLLRLGSTLTRRAQHAASLSAALHAVYGIAPMPRSPRPAGA
jgi:hypothetical protein